MLTVLVTGYRDWTDKRAIGRELLAVRRLHPDAAITLVHGGCSGADLIAGALAERLGWRVVEMKADWSRGKKAGPERNQAMIDTHPPDVALVFMHPASRGTVDCLRRIREFAKTHRVEIRVTNAKI